VCVCVCVCVCVYIKYLNPHTDMHHKTHTRVLTFKGACTDRLPGLLSDPLDAGFVTAIW
jgi:hypothetical protein